jgi:hypothetical protein
MIASKRQYFVYCGWIEQSFFCTDNTYESCFLRYSGYSWSGNFNIFFVELSPLEKMLIAFFRISRSICSARSSFFKLATSCSAALRITFSLPGKLLPCLFENYFRDQYSDVTLIFNSFARVIRNGRV